MIEYLNERYGSKQGLLLTNNKRYYIKKREFDTKIGCSVCGGPTHLIRPIEGVSKCDECRLKVEKAHYRKQRKEAQKQFARI